VNDVVNAPPTIVQLDGAVIIPPLNVQDVSLGEKPEPDTKTDVPTRADEGPSEISGEADVTTN
jgi:hypothetical protein